jgi:hypothetical protein
MALKGEASSREATQHILSRLRTDGCMPEERVAKGNGLDNPLAIGGSSADPACRMGAAVLANQSQRELVDAPLNHGYAAVVVKGAAI